MKSTQDEIRAAAESSTEKFIKLTHPRRVLGSIHSEALAWMDREDHKSHQILLLPRDHQKSALIAYRAARRITQDPAVRILYISSTSTLAVKQVKFIKDILTSPIYRKYWPGMVNPNEGLREKWTETEFSVDHPKRREENIRDSTVFCAGLTTSITGLHADIVILDDVVVRENAYTEEGRAKVREQYSLLASIEGTDAEQWVVGTRYHPQDLYNDMLNMEVEEFSDDGDVIASEPLYEVFRDGNTPVEDRGDGGGEFLWPRQQRADGKVFGFDQKILAKKRAQYLDKTQYYAQYYNDPNRDESNSISRERFQYYDRKFLNRQNGVWFMKGKRLNIIAAMDFAFTKNAKSDFSSIVVVGVDSDSNYYVLDIDRFQTGDQSSPISEYYRHLLALHQKWDFRKVICEVTAAQSVIVNDLKHNYIVKYGLALSVQDFRPNRQMGVKEERISAILQPRYAENQIWHYLGGNCQVLEDELIMSHPPHDDVKDALATAIDGLVAPSRMNRVIHTDTKPSFHPIFGGFV